MYTNEYGIRFWYCHHMTVMYSESSHFKSSGLWILHQPQNYACECVAMVLPCRIQHLRLDLMHDEASQLHLHQYQLTQCHVPPKPLKKPNDFYFKLHDVLIENLIIVTNRKRTECGFHTWKCCRRQLSDYQCLHHRLLLHLSTFCLNNAGWFLFNWSQSKI